MLVHAISLISEGYSRRVQEKKENSRSNLVCRVVYSQSETGRQTVLHTEVHHVTILRIAP